MMLFRRVSAAVVAVALAVWKTPEVLKFAPTDVVHFGVHEPGERVGARDAGLGDADALDVLMAAVGSGALERVVLRSGIEIYGRGRRHPKFPAEDAPLAPTTPYGRTLLAVEEAAARIGAELDVAVCALRLAPVAASHTPSPVARVLRLPVVPVPALADAFTKAGLDNTRGRKILQLMLDSGSLVKVHGDMLFHQEALDALIQKLRAHAVTQSDRSIDVGSFKELAGISRKYAIPLLEYFDRQRVTR